MMKSTSKLLLAIIASACVSLLPGSAQATNQHMSKSQLKTQLSKTIAKVRTGSTATIRDEAAKHLAELTRGIDPHEVDDETVTDLVSLLDQPVGRYWVARCLGNLGIRAKIAIPKLQRLLPEEDCLQVSKSAAEGIRFALTQMGVTPPPPPNCKAKKEQE